MHSENYKSLNVLKRFMEECKKDLGSNVVAEVVLTEVQTFNCKNISLNFSYEVFFLCLFIPDQSPVVSPYQKRIQST